MTDSSNLIEHIYDGPAKAFVISTKARSPFLKAQQGLRPLRLKPRTVRALASFGIQSLEDLRRLTNRDLNLIRGVGPSAVAQIKLYLNRETKNCVERSPSLVISARFDAHEVDALEKWAAENGLSRSQALRFLVEKSLETRLRIDEFRTNVENALRWPDEGADRLQKHQ